MQLAGVFTRVDSASVTKLVVVVGLPLLIVALAFLTPPAYYVDRWAANRGLRLTDANRRLVDAYIKRTRRLRTIGGATGFLVVVAPGSLYMLVDPDSGLGRTLRRLGMGKWFAVSLIVGYLAGALVAELSLARPRDRWRSGAALLPREVKQYVTPWARYMLWGLAAILVAAIPLPAILTLEKDSGGVASVARYTGLAAAVAVVEGLQRMIVRRPQSFVDPSMVEADDAVRSSSVHACLGVGLTIVMSLAATVLTEISYDAVVGPIRWILRVPSIACVFASLFVWLSFGTSYAWAVRRQLAIGSPRSPAST